MNNEYWLSGYELNNKSVEDIIKLVTDANKEHLIINHGMEWEPYPQVRQLSDLCVQRSIKLTILLAGTGIGIQQKHQLDFPNVNIEYWPTFWIYWGLLCLKNMGGCIEDKPRLKEPLSIQFLSLSGQPHLHRCLIIDELAKRNMISRGAVNWLRAGDNRPIVANLPNGFQFKHFEEKRLSLSDNWKLGDNSFILPPEYDRSSIILISESTHRTIFSTEKTVQAIARRKPWICVGGAGQNHWTEKEFDFKLLHDFIDYSWDLEEDLQKRVEGAIDQLEKWIDRDDWHNLEYKVNDILIHNHRQLYKLLHERVWFPKIVVDMMERKDDRYPETRNLLMMDNLKYPD